MAEASHGDKVSHYHWLSFLIMLIKTFDENDRHSDDHLEAKVFALRVQLAQEKVLLTV